MRNLKKILALVLALVMSLSLVTTAGAFSDGESISADYKDAVDVLNDLKVFQGYSDGEFKPKNNITRAEVAAIIYRIATADTADTQKDIYSTYGQFNDVRDGDWYAGYVNYCANAGYIKGRGNKTFDPQASVTGYEALAMILRAVGYDKNGEFTGSNWQIRTASTGQERGITKNVKETLLGQAATREIVAEILFRSILVPKVDFNANTLSYTVKGAKDTIGYQSFKLEELKGIVTGNEYADLENTSTMRDGKTRLVVDGTPYTLDYKEDSVLDGWDAIGEEHAAYITNANTTSAKVIGSMVKTEGRSWSTLSDDGIDSASDFRNKTGFQRNDSDIEYYVNFDNNDWHSDWRIKYVLTSRNPIAADSILEARRTIQDIQNNSNFILPELTVVDGETSATAFTARPRNYTLDSDGHLVYTREFKINDTISPNDKRNIEEVFNIADKTTPANYVRGEVYVGTTSLNDISDSISFKQFVDQYINDNSTKITGNERGNWLKVIDNDGDGQADIVLKVVYTMAQVLRAKDGKYGLDTQNALLTDGDAVNQITRDDAVSEDTLALNDIVYYTYVDDVIRAWKAGTASVKLETVNRKDLKVVTTDGTEYTQSGVHGNHVVSREYNSGVVNMNGSATYDIYLDRGGYLALFTDSNAGDFKLIVDGWFNNTKAGAEYAARVYNDETGRQDVVDITRGGNMFIDGNVTIGNVQNNAWNALKWLGGVNAYAPNTGNPGALTDAPAGRLNGNGVLNNGTGTAVKTTVATLTGDGVILPVDYASNSNTGRNVVMVAPIDRSGKNENIIPGSAATWANVYTTGVSLNQTDTAYDTVLRDNTGTVVDVELRALSNTVYYLVYPRENTESGFAVERYVGYSSVPRIDADKIEDVYAVATAQTRNSTLGNEVYYTANVVVVELSRDYTGFAEQVFIYNMPVANSSVTIEDVELIHENGSLETVRVDFNASRIRDYNRAADVAGNNSLPGSVWGPGLYYLYPTNTEGLYTVEAMTPAQIAENSYAVGWAGTALGTLSSDYVSVVMFDNSETNGNPRDDGTYRDSGVAYGVTEKSAANANIYTLSYNDRGLADLGTYAASDGNIQTYLGERKDENSRYTGGFPYDHTPFDVEGCTTYWNQNRVLIHYSGNSVQYAISFANMDGNNYNRARWVWANNRPAASAWMSVENGRETAIDYAQFMANKKVERVKGVYNIEDIVKVAMARALWNNENLNLINTGSRKSDHDIGEEVYELCRELVGVAVGAPAGTKGTNVYYNFLLDADAALAAVEKVLTDANVASDKVKTQYDALVAAIKAVRNNYPGYAKDVATVTKNETDLAGYYNKADGTLISTPGGLVEAFMNAVAAASDPKVAELNAAKTAAKAALAAYLEGLTAEQEDDENVKAALAKLQAVIDGTDTAAINALVKDGKLDSANATVAALDKAVSEVGKEPEEPVAIDFSGITGTDADHAYVIGPDFRPVTQVQAGDKIKADPEIALKLTGVTGEPDEDGFYTVASGVTEIKLEKKSATWSYNEKLEMWLGMESGAMVVGQNVAVLSARARAVVEPGDKTNWLADVFKKVLTEQKSYTIMVGDVEWLAESVPGGVRFKLVGWDETWTDEQTSAAMNSFVDAAVDAIEGNSEVEVKYDVYEDPYETERAEAEANVEAYEKDAIAALDATEDADAIKAINDAKAVALDAIKNLDNDAAAITAAVADYKAAVAEIIGRQDVNPGAIVVEPVGDGEKINSAGNVGIQIQSNIQVENGADDNSRVVTGQTKYTTVDSFSGAGYQVALKIGVPGATVKDMKISSTTADASHGLTTSVDGVKWKTLTDNDKDGTFEDGTEYVIVTRRLDEDKEAKTPNIMHVMANNIRYTIDFSKVDRGDPTAKLTVRAVDTTEAVKEESKDYKVLGGKLQNITVDSDPDDETGTRFIAKGNVFNTTLDANTYTSAATSGFFVALKVSYPGADASDMTCGIGETGKTDADFSKVLGKSSEKEGLIVAKIDGTKTKAEIAVKVFGKTFKIDVSKVTLGSENKRLVVNAADPTKTIEGQKVSERQNVTITPVDDTTFKAEGKVYWLSDTVRGDNTWYSKSGYWLILEVDEKASNAFSWDEFHLLSTGVNEANDSNKFPATDDEKSPGAVIWRINSNGSQATGDYNNLGLKKNNPRIVYDGVTYTIDISGLELVAPVELVAASETDLKATSPWDTVELDQVCHIETETNWATNTIYVKGDAYYYANMPGGFANDTRVNGYYVVLAEKGDTDAGRLHIKSTTNGSGHNWGDNGTQAAQKACVWGLRDLKDGVMNTTVEGFDTVWTLDFSKLTLTEKFDAKSTDATSSEIASVTKSGVTPGTLNKTETTVEGDRVVVRGEAYKVDEANKLDNWNVESEKTGYYVVVDFTYHKDNPLAVFGSSEGTLNGKMFGNDSSGKKVRTDDVLTLVIRIADVDGNRVGEMQIGRNANDNDSSKNVVFVKDAVWQIDTSAVDLIDKTN